MEMGSLCALNISSFSYYKIRYLSSYITVIASKFHSSAIELSTINSTHPTSPVPSDKLSHPTTAIPRSP